MEKILSDRELILEEIKRREALFNYYYENFKKHYNSGSLPKASEFLWGALHSLLYAIALLENKKLSNHGKVIEFATYLANKTEKKEIYEGIKLGEDLHANFYHDFLNKEGLDLKVKKIEEAINTLGEILNLEIKKSYNS